MARPTTVKTLPRIVGVAGGRDEERRIEGEHRREDKENQSQNPPAGYHRGGGGRDKRRKPTQNGKVAQPTVPRGGEVPSRKRTSKEKTKQRASQRKGDKTYSPVLLCE